MADDESQLGSSSTGNWWDTTRIVPDAPSSISTTLNSMASLGGHGHGGVLQVANPNLQMMGLGLSSDQGMEDLTWNQTLLGEKGEDNFRTNDFQHKLYSSSTASPDHQDSMVNDFTQINRGFSLDQTTQFSSQASSNDSTITSQNLNAGFQLDSASAVAYGGYLLPESNENRLMNNNYSYLSSGYSANSAELIASTWNKLTQSSRISPPKQPNTTPYSSSNHLHFTNNMPFWNASAPAAAAVADSRSSFFPALQPHNIPAAPSFDDKRKNASEVQDMGTATALKKNSTVTTTTSNKRPRKEMSSSLPTSKVRKAKMGDRITALQQLVSPFGKTDTASVLSEAIENIKFLHEQVNALSTPYMKNGASIQHHQNSDNSIDPEAPRQDLRSRGLCLVPVSSTFPVTHETAVDFWTPTFGGSFR